MNEYSAKKKEPGAVADSNTQRVKGLSAAEIQTQSRCDLLSIS